MGNKKTCVMKVSYDGSMFYGYAKQNNLKTIQATLEEHLSNIYQTDISIHSSGRTDKHVHAIDQTIHYRTKVDRDLDVVRNYLNKKLEGIYIKKLFHADDSFHSRFSIKNKTYTYLINCGDFDVFKEKYELQYCQDLNIEKLKEIINLFVGEKDFKSFTTSEAHNTVRKVNYIKIYKANKKIMIVINGDGFLRYMVRMIVGTMIEYCESKKSYKDIEYLFDNPKKGSCISKARGCGLYLTKTNY